MRLLWAGRKYLARGAVTNLGEVSHFYTTSQIVVYKNCMFQFTDYKQRHVVGKTLVNFAQNGDFILLYHGITD